AIAKEEIAREANALLLADRGIKLGAGHRKFPERDLPVEQLPAVATLLAADARDEIVRVEAGDERHRADAFAARVEPQRGLRRDQRKPVTGLARPPVADAGRVVPLPVEVRDGC